MVFGHFAHARHKSFWLLGNDLHHWSQPNTEHHNRVSIREDFIYVSIIGYQEGTNQGQQHKVKLLL
jgi:hypothetical protein